MVNSRLYVRLTNQTQEMKLCCCFYASHGSKSKFISLSTCCDHSSRYAYLESLLDNAALQPYVHDCLLTIKRHMLLPTNHTIRSLSNVVFKGDVVIACVTVHNELSLVNMQARDDILADFAMTNFRFLRYAKAIQKWQILCDHQITDGPPIVVATKYIWELSGCLAMGKAVMAPGMNKILRKVQNYSLKRAVQLCQVASLSSAAQLNQAPLTIVPDTSGAAAANPALDKGHADVAVAAVGGA
ncbi:hypothetical protein BDN71DRAFT_1431206 [Pleurotus eryngii]|uniref:Uncharacterized protein n=1 Tax=Pleurotus eryngii TaxID=5323 RepID=A0A9P5ZX45_PLEER|nr:hypothetical protein BDN71DRAFT_1431206 [Pleurotus eryngii]